MTRPVIVCRRPQRTGRPIATLAVGAALFAAALCLSSATHAAQGDDRRSPAAPELVVPTLDGGTFDLSAQRGKVVLVNFWATWCVPCRQEIPALNEFYGRYHDQGVEMIGLSADKSRDIGQVRKMLADLHYPVALANAAKRNTFEDPRSLPVTYVIDRTGTVRAELRPATLPVTAANLEKTVLPLLEAPNP